MSFNQIFPICFLLDAWEFSKNRTAITFHLCPAKPFPIKPGTFIGDQKWGYITWKISDYRSKVCVLQNSAYFNLFKKNFRSSRKRKNLVEALILEAVNPVKGRRSSMDDRYGLYRQGSRALRSMRNGDFQEQDVWDTLNEREDYSSMAGSSTESSIFSPRRLPSAARMIPRNHINSNPIHESRVVQQSAPVKIPDWSKIYGKNSNKSSSKNTSWLDDNDDDEGDDGSDDDDDDDVDVDDDVDAKLPPHEWLAKKYERSRISSFSVFEGVGRKLKGRDLSRVRNAVLTNTGFLE